MMYKSGNRIYKNPHEQRRENFIVLLYYYIKSYPVFCATAFKKWYRLLRLMLFAGRSGDCDLAIHRTGTRT